MSATQRQDHNVRIAIRRGVNDALKAMIGVAIGVRDHDVLDVHEISRVIDELGRLSLLAETLDSNDPAPIPSPIRSTRAMSMAPTSTSPCVAPTLKLVL